MAALERQRTGGASLDDAVQAIRDASTTTAAADDSAPTTTAGVGTGPTATSEALTHPKVSTAHGSLVLSAADHGIIEVQLFLTR